MEVDGGSTWNHETVFSVLAAVTISKDVMSFVLSELILYMKSVAKCECHLKHS